MQDHDMKTMLIDYMGKGFLDNIIALFRQDSTVYRYLADMLGDDNIRVRLGATALVEELARDNRRELQSAVPGVVALLKHENPTIRGDAASVLGIIKDKGSAGALRECLEDSHPGVREAARDALEEMKKE